eukprot:gnl/Hemi2/3018_TR1063_c0_g1_i1.p1 gnl/Hemi2/3018_TR1063_c0_g1~~gnl/Hemi2/3018_TR1063_c0_g1_i1.p1  ORF type:complete len:466 (-),score=124.92 gnl/Hemi2/3018_TR1063_c0_g1_i1:191-1588(-)
MKVCIIGAGIAGLTAARELREHAGAVELTIFESEDRVGGRIRDFNGYQLGAQWIHGSTGPDGAPNPILTLIKRLNMTTTETSGDSAIPGEPNEMALYDRNGRLAEAEVKALVDSGWDFIDEVISTPSTDPKVTVQQVLDSSLASPERFNSVAKRRMQWFVDCVYPRDWAEDPDHLPLSVDEGYFDYEGTDHVVDGSFMALINKMAEGASVELSQRVVHVDYTSSKSVRVITEKGRVWEGDAVICTVPLGVLKAGGIRFNPHLPDAKLASIDKLGFGCLSQVVVEFEKPFWPEEVAAFMWVDDDPKDIPCYAVNLCGPPHFKNALCFYEGGRYGRVIEARSDEENLEWAMRFVRKIWGPSVTKPTKVATSRFSVMPSFYGCYTHLRRGTTVADLKTLSEPLANRLFFAGEHTSHEVQWASVSAGFQSGLRGAKEVLQAFGLNPTPATRAATSTTTAAAAPKLLAKL